MELKKQKRGSEILNRLKKLFAEFLGTFTLTYIGSWAIIFSDIDELGSDSVGFAHGVTLTIFTWILHRNSGAHFNPAVTLGMIVIRKINWSTGMFYIIVQFLGAICAALFIQAQLGVEIADAISEKSLIGLPRPDSGIYNVSGMWTELFGTFVLVYVYCAFNVDHAKTRPLEVFPVAIGFAYFLCYITVGDVSGGGFNPARALGPAIIIGKMGNTQFMQFFGPLAGAVLAALLYKLIFVDEDDEDEEEEGYTDEIKEYSVPVNEKSQMIELQ